MAINVGDKQVISVATRNRYALQAWLGDRLLWEQDTTPPPGWVPPASDLTNTCNGPEGTEVTVESSAGGGDPFQMVSNWTYEAEGMSTPPVSQIALAQWDATGVAAIPDVQQSVGFWLIAQTVGTAGVADLRNESNTTTHGGIQWQGGTLRAVAGTTQIPESASPELVLGRRYWVTYGINNAAAGSHRLLVQNPDGSVFHDWTGPLTGTGDLIGFRHFGKVSTSVVGLTLATIKATSGVSTGLPLEDGSVSPYKFWNTFEGGTIGEAITPENSGGASGVPFDDVSAPTIVYAADGFESAQAGATPDDTNGEGYVQWNDDADTTTVAVGMWINLGQWPAEGDRRIVLIQYGPPEAPISAGGLGIRMIGRWRLVDGNVISQPGQMLFPVDPGVWHWVTAWFDWEAKKGRFQVYLSDGSLIHESFELDLTVSTATSTNRVVFMRPQKMSLGATRFDFLAYHPGATGPLPPWNPDTLSEPEPPPVPA